MRPADMAELGSMAPENVNALVWREWQKGILGSRKGAWGLWIGDVEIPIRNVTMHVTPCSQGDERK